MAAADPSIAVAAGMMGTTASTSSQVLTAASSSSPAAAVAAAATSHMFDSPISAAMQLRLSLQLVCAALTGAAIGKERSGIQKYHPAGVRTMSLVSMGAALFTICSRYGFAGTHYDTSRMASNVASGVGFIGAGVIYHEQCSQVVHGLTTAAAIWISAAVGVACGTGLYIVATVATGLTLGILRLAGVVKQLKKRRTKIIKCSSKLLVNPSSTKRTTERGSDSPSKARRGSIGQDSSSSTTTSDLQDPLFPNAPSRQAERFPENDDDDDDDAFEIASDMKKKPTKNWFDIDDDKARAILLKNINQVPLWQNQTSRGGAP
ncbi:hypothetical protein ACA910_000614 [Epithemia clementina (nom. ined.)]